MNGKKSKLLRKLARMNVADKEQAFSVVQHLKSDRTHTLSTGKIVTLPLVGRSIDRSCGKYLYKQMKRSYHDMKPLYSGARAYRL